MHNNLKQIIEIKHSGTKFASKGKVVHAINNALIKKQGKDRSQDKKKAVHVEMTG